MFGLFRSMSQGAGVAIGYITGGVLVMIWTAIWYYWLTQHKPQGDWTYYVCSGLFFSGLAVTLIGILVGRIGRSAKKADNADVLPAAQPAPAPVPVAPAPVIVTQPVAPQYAAPAPQSVTRVQPT